MVAVARPLGGAGAVRRFRVSVGARAAAGRAGRPRLLRRRHQGLHRRPRRRAGRRVHRAGQKSHIKGAIQLWTSAMIWDPKFQFEM